MDIKSTLEKYSESIPLLERYRVKLESLIMDLLDGLSIPYHVIESRTKSLESLINKIQRRGKAYKNPLSEITDLVGLRIILYYLEDVDKVYELINNEFKILQEHSSNKLDTFKPNEFGYLSIHSVLKLNAQRSKLSEWKNFKNLYAEIQIRTVLQHSWASTSHILLYKKESDAPDTLKRNLIDYQGYLNLRMSNFKN